MFAVPTGLIVDNFAGGGGASTGIEMALGRSPDYAINHDPQALAMHAANHPDTIHLCESVWDVDIRTTIAGRHISLAWFSPDCKHFSKAKGGKPVEKNIRGLAWIVLKWAAVGQPDVIVLENVEEFQTWGPLVDNLPCPRRKGMTFRRWVEQLRNLGYEVEWRELRACDFGAPTIRKRLFVVARRDRRKIEWPRHTHGAAGNLFLAPYRTAAECIDWSIRCPSIFGRKKPLAEATLRRIARGIQRYVIDDKKPFLVNLTHQGGDRIEGLDEPFRTITGANRGEKAFVQAFFHAAPFVVNMAHGGKLENATNPMSTIATEKGGCRALVAAFLAQHNSERNGYKAGRSANDPLSTITSTAGQQQLVTSHLIHLKGTCKDGYPVSRPMPTVQAEGTHIGEVRAFLVKYFGTDQNPRLNEPLHTVTSKDRFGLVMINGEAHQIVDIGMRMLTPRELFRAQGFPMNYRIDPLFNGKPLTKTAQVRMCGNSVSPPAAEAIIRALFSSSSIQQAA